MLRVVLSTVGISRNHTNSFIMLWQYKSGTLCVPSVSVSPPRARHQQHTMQRYLGSQGNVGKLTRQILRQLYKYTPLPVAKKYLCCHRIYSFVLSNVENICNTIRKYLCRLLRAAVLPVPDAQDSEQPEQVGGAVLPPGLLLPLPTRPAAQAGDQAQVGNIVIILLFVILLVFSIRF